MSKTGDFYGVGMNTMKARITFDEAVEKLGLQPFAEFAKQSKYPPRRTGRTTRLLVKAVVRSQDDLVQLKAYNPTIEQYRYEQALEMAKTLGLDTNNILPPQEKNPCVIFLDHHPDDWDDWIGQAE